MIYVLKAHWKSFKWWYVLSALLMLFGLAQEASAADISKHKYTNSGDYYILITGELEDGDAVKLQEQLVYGKFAKDIYLNSNGGLVTEGWAMANLIRNQNRNTFVYDGHTCASACTYAFMGGVKRVISPKASMGYHPASVEGSSSTDNINTFFDHAQTSTVRTIKNYLMYVSPGKEWEMMVFIDRIYSTTYNYDMYWAKTGELMAAGVITDFWN